MSPRWRSLKVESLILSVVMVLAIPGLYADATREIGRGSVRETQVSVMGNIPSFVNVEGLEVASEISVQNGIIEVGGGELSEAVDQILENKFQAGGRQDTAPAVSARKQAVPAGAGTLAGGRITEQLALDRRVAMVLNDVKSIQQSSFQVANPVRTGGVRELGSGVKFGNSQASRCGDELELR